MHLHHRGARTSGWIGAAALSLLAATVVAGEPSGDGKDAVTPVLASPPATSSLARKQGSSRWNDRTTPRRTLETFYFAIVGYDLTPELIANAIDCLDLSGLGSAVSEANAALLAHDLNSILTRQDIALYSVPDVGTAIGGEVILASSETMRLALRRQTDGRWRFDAETVRRISTMRLESFRAQREIQEARMKLHEGRTDPEATMRTFLGDVIRKDFIAAARCLDLRDVPSKLRALRGPDMARKLAFVIQRCGFVFPQEIVSDPDGWRYIWHSNHRGRIMIDRVRQSDDKDAWLFSRMTLRNLDALVEGFRFVHPDPRYEFVGVAIEASTLTEGDKNATPAPKGVPSELGSARATLGTFLEGMEDLELDDSRARLVLSCLDLAEVTESDRTAVGLRLASKLESVLQHLNVDLLGVSESWGEEPQTFVKEPDWKVTVARQPDGAWRFEGDTVARIPEMFDQLDAREKGHSDRADRFGTARQTMRTLIRAVIQRDDTLAARALDLSAIPSSAQSEIGPVLAHKLKFVVDRIGGLRLQEVPNEVDSPRFIYYRGPIGRISLEPAGAGPRQGEWLFTAETVAAIEPMFLAVLAQRPGSKSTVSAALPEAVTSTLLPLRIRASMPPWLRHAAMGLELYQWLGTVVVLVITAGASWLALRTVDLLLRWTLRRAGSRLSDEFLRAKLLPLACQLDLYLIGLQLPFLDLPASLMARIVPVNKCLWIALMAWMAIRLIDLMMAVYINSEHLQLRRNLSDMIVPTFARFLKLSVLLVALSMVVYLIGNGEWVARLLAGLGLVGLAASLAAQDTLKSLFGTLFLIGEHPFKIGDYIVVTGMEGTVESVGFRSTWIRTLDDSLITIPNSIIANASIDNRGARTHRRYRAFVGVAYETPLDRLVALRDALRAWAIANPLIPSDKIDIHIHTLNSSSIDILVNVYFKVSTLTEELVARDELTRTILDQSSLIGVQIAFATQTFQLLPPAEGHGAIPPPRFSRKGWPTTGGVDGDKATLRVDS